MSDIETLTSENPDNEKTKWVKSEKTGNWQPITSVSVPPKTGTVDGGTKFDGDKPPVFQGVLQYFPRAIMEVARISAFGAAKYAWGGWRHIPDGYRRVSDAEARHTLLKGIEGDYDSESGFLHDGHIAWNSLAKLELYLIEKEKNGRAE